MVEPSFPIALRSAQDPAGEPRLIGLRTGFVAERPSHILRVNREDDRRGASWVARRRLDPDRQVEKYLASYRAVAERWNVECSTVQPTGVQRGFYARSNPV